MLEGLGAFTAIMIASLMVFLQRRGLIEPVYAWVASALIALGVFDGLHALLHAGQAFVLFHSIAVFAGGILFMGVWLPENWQAKSQVPVI